MGGKVWSSEELDTLELLAGDVPWPALPQIYWNTVRQHGYPRRTGTALRRKCNDLGLQRAAIGRWVNAGLICQLMDISYEAVQTWMRNGLIAGKRFGSTQGHRYAQTPATPPSPLRRNWHHLPLDQRSSPRRLRHPQVHLRGPRSPHQNQRLLHLAHPHQADVKFYN
jgi:hypothetical protein